MQEKTSITIIKTIPQKIKQKPKTPPKFKPKKLYIFISLLYFVLLIIISILCYQIFNKVKKNALSKQKNQSNRNLYYNNDPYYNSGSGSYSTTKTSNNSNDDSLDPIAVIVVVLYAFFIVLSLYIACELKKLSKSDEVCNNVLKYIYMANNGYLFISLIDSAMKASGMSIATLGISIVICVIGTIIYLVKFCKVIFSNFFEQYFGYEMLSSWFRLPCSYIWDFVSLTDPYCYSDTYTVYYYSDGTTSDDKCFVQAYNTFCYLVKRLSLILSTLVYYMFLLMLTVVWGIIKILYEIFKNVKCNFCSKGSSNIDINIGAGNNQNNVMVYGQQGNYEINYNNNQAIRRYQRNKSQVLPNNMNIANNNNIINSLNMGTTMRLSQNYNSNNSNVRRRNTLNRTSFRNQENMISIEDV